MKIPFLFLALIFTCSATCLAQFDRLSVNASIGYTLQDKITFNDSYYAYIEDAAQYGIMLEYDLKADFSMGLSYNHISTHIPIYDPYRQKQNQGSDATGINYFMIEGIKYFRIPLIESIVAPYLGAGVGGTFINVKSGDIYTRFAWDAKLGIKVKVSARISLFAQAVMQSIVQGINGNMYINASSSGVGLDTYSNIYQFTFGGGIGFNF